MDRKLDIAISQLQVCAVRIDQVKNRLRDVKVSPRGHDGPQRRQPSSDADWGCGHSSTGASPSRQLSENVLELDEVFVDDVCRKTTGAWLQPVVVEGADAGLKPSNTWVERAVSDADSAWPGDELRVLADEGSAAPNDTERPAGGSATWCGETSATSDMVRTTGESVRSARSSKEDDSDDSLEGVVRLHRRGVLAEKTWNMMTDDDSIAYHRWARLWVCFVLFSVVFTLAQALEQPLLPMVEAAVMETVIDVLFGLELLVRFATVPDTKHFVTNPFNVVDFLSVLPIVPRALVDFTLPRQLDARNLPVLLLVCGVPMLRLAKVLRWTGVQMKLFERVLASTMETLQFLALCGSLMILHFAFWIFLVEPRDSVDTYWRAIWLVIVTMTTVGYGDVYPESDAGQVVVAILIGCSVLFMAIPIGVLGNAFAFVWSERDLILLVDQTRRRLEQWGHSPDDLPQFFRRFDSDGDGELSLDEFIDMMTALKVTLKGDRMIELFEVFDRDHGGSVDEREFMRAVFPKAFHERAQREKGEKEKKERQEMLQKKKARQERRRTRATEQGRSTVATEQGRLTVATQQGRSTVATVGAFGDAEEQRPAAVAAGARGAALALAASRRAAGGEKEPLDVALVQSDGSLRSTSSSKGERHQSAAKCKPDKPSLIRVAASGLRSPSLNARGGSTSAELRVEVIGDEERVGASREQEEIARSTSVNWFVGAPAEGEDVRVRTSGEGSD